MLALATAMAVGASPAGAQSFLGTGTPNNGAATTITTGPGTTTIAVTAPQTVINWVPTDNATNNGVGINFQNSGTTASFLGNGNFAVLNNIVAADLSRVISMNGTITAGALGAAAAANGSIYFYAPSGILLGNSSMINVGSLVLSASPIFVDPNGNFINGSAQQVIFGSAPRATASITTNAQSQINGTATDSYVAMVAPRVVHTGTITVSGSAALVGAEAAVINFSPDGLFDIQVTTGTTDANGVVNTGNIGGSASTGATDARRAFLVAVPKNTALTMAINAGADLGFDIAGSANVSGNAVILSAGHDIVDGEVGAVSSAAGALANISAGGMNATSAVRAVATNNAEFLNSTSSSFASDLSITAPGHAWLSSFGTGTSVTVGRDLVLTSNGTATAAGGSATGGSAALYGGDNGMLTVGRDATITANGVAGNSSTAGVSGGIGTGGFATIQTQSAGATISVGRNALVSASGTGGSGLVTGANGGAGSGGFATIRTFVGANSAVNIAGTATVQANGTGGSALGCVGCIGGLGTGGNANAFAELNGTVGVTGMLRINADGLGGPGATGRGGAVSLISQSDAAISAGSLNASADGTGGNDAGAGAGNGFGGSATLRATGTGSSVAITNIVTTGTLDQRDFLSVEGFGGTTNGGGSGIGGTGTGGSLLIQGTSGGSITLPTVGALFGVPIMARGYGGGASGNGTTGGLGQGGTLTLALDNASLTSGPLQLSAYGFGGDAIGTGNITGGNGVGGTRSISAVNGSTLTFSTPAGYAGGGGGAGSGTGNGGNASGGSASLLVDNSTVNFTAASIISTETTGGNGAIGGNASGGTSSVTIRNGGIVNVANDPSTTLDFTLDANAFGGDFLAAPGTQGGNAVAGTAQLLLDGGTINLTGNMSVGAQAFGGASSATGGIGGNATGGTTAITATGANSQINGVGALTLTTDASGGSSTQGTGGNATAGTATITAEGGAGLTIQSPLTVQSEATGGNGATGGNATGGTVRVRALTGGDLTFTGASLTIFTDADGGNGNGGNGGNGVGGAFTELFADGAGSTITISGLTDVSSDADGGNSNGAIGGSGTGGNIDVYTQNGGSLTINNNLIVSAGGFGGAGATGGGNARGGTPSIASFGTLTVNGTLTAHANALGGQLYFTDFNGFAAGDATGGTLEVFAQGGTLTVTGAANLSADATGGAVGNSLDLAGDGTGGTARLFANAGGSVSLQSTLDISATGRSGSSISYGSGIGGTGRGGTVRVQATAADAIVTVAGTALLDASGFGSSGNQCFACGIGGSGFGGTAVAEAFGAATARLNFNSAVDIDATGEGGNSGNGTGGYGQGGRALLEASQGATVNVDGGASLDASALGGTSLAFSNGMGGNALGGLARLQTFGTTLGGTIVIDGSASVSADGVGGDALGFVNAVAGNGTGGIAQILTTLGNITIGMPGSGGGAFVAADGYGGYADDGAGGDGAGGEYAEIAAVNGDITIDGFAEVSASGFGGDGAVGGDGFGSANFDPVTGLSDEGAYIYAQNGDIVIKGGASVSSMGIGGDADFIDPYGGDFGGAGGAGYGGYAQIYAANSNAGPSSITITSGMFEGSGIAAVSVDGIGGDGGTGGDGDTGGTGGAGYGGSAGISAGAGNGNVTIDQVLAFARGIGGAGGDGGFSEIGAGGNGGVGGLGDAGSITVGTISGIGQAAAINLGFGNYGTIFADASGTGGTGGDGAFGLTNGSGGNGGAALGGGVDLLVRGSRVDVDVATLYANATGGNGGLGDGMTSSDGDGGNATVGSTQGFGFIVGISVLATGRFQNPSQRGVLNAGAIIGESIAVGGNGAIDGTGLSLGGSKVQFLNADGNIGSLDFVVDADGVGPNVFEESISVINGTVIVDDNFSFTTIGNLSLFADNGSLTADTITLDAANFVADRQNVTPANAGTYFARLFDITTDLNFITTANLDSVEALVIDAPGRIEVGNVTADADFDLIADSSIALGNGLAAGTIDLSAGSFISGGFLDATGAITTLSTGNTTLGFLDAGTTIFQRANGFISEGNVTAGGFVDIRSAGGINLGNVMAGDYIDARSTGSINLLNATAGETINFQTPGTLTGLNMAAGNSFTAQAMGAIQLGSISAGIVDPSSVTGARYSVGIGGGASIVTGAISALGTIGFGTPTTLTTGNLTSGGGVLALAGGNASFGSINTGPQGYVYIANHSMAALGGPFETFNRAPILALEPVATGGSIAMGTVDTGRFQAAAGTTLTATSITSRGLLYGSSGGNMQLGDLSAGGNVLLTSGGSIAAGGISSGNDIELDAIGGITFGAVNAGSFDFTAGGAVSGGNIVARTFAVGEAEGAIVLGDITTTQASPIDDFSIGYASATSIRVGNVTGVDEVGFATFGDLTAGNVRGGNLFMALVGGDMTTGSITTATNGRVYIADSAMFATGGGGGDGDFNPAPVLALAPVATGGSVAINGPVVTGRFQAAAGDNLSTGAITATQIDASAGLTAGINGLWRAGQVSLRSGDINITATGGIDAGTNGTILLNAVNTNGGALIGDGLTGTGYALSNAEFSRIGGGDITIAVGGFGGDADTLIGDLAITGNNIKSATGGVEFITLQENGLALDGTLRVVGDILATGFGADNYLGFYTQNFELNATTGTISLTGNAGVLAGTLELYATRIHVAEASLLNQLAVNPQFSGYRQALNKPAAVARPDGVIRAANFDIGFGGASNAGPYTLFVQNMGTTTLPAGFLLSAANIGDDGDAALAAGSLDLVINGQIQSGTGTLTGVAVRDLLVTEFGTEIFVAGSTINGCPLVGACSVAPVQVITPTSTDVQIAGVGGLGDGLFGNEGEIAGEDSGGEGGSSSPINAPNPLFDSRPLAGSSEVDDPVSGAGNPSLYGTSDEEECDPSDKNNICETGKKGDGK